MSRRWIEIGKNVAANIRNNTSTVLYYRENEERLHKLIEDFDLEKVRTGVTNYYLCLQAALLDGKMREMWGNRYSSKMSALGYVEDKRYILDAGFFDHTLYFKNKDGIICVTQPYDRPESLEGRVSAFCKERGLEYVICKKGYDLHNSATTMVMLMSPEMKKKYKDIIERDYTAK